MLDSIFSAGGILLSGIVLIKVKPTARQITAWAIFCLLCTALANFSYIWLGCEQIVDLQLTSSELACSTECRCDNVPYDPVCGQNGKTYNSACHAGCLTSETHLNNMTSGHHTAFNNCSCIDMDTAQGGGSAKPGSCDVDCHSSFLYYLATQSALNFLSSTCHTVCTLVCLRQAHWKRGRSCRQTSFNHLDISFRIVHPKDKAFSMSLFITIISILGIIPSPILYGKLMDMTCLVWTESCSGRGNCWAYDPWLFRYCEP